MTTSPPCPPPGGDEHRVLQLVAAHLEIARRQYGLLRDCDSQNWKAEMLEELLDNCVYLAIRLLRVRQKEGNDANQ